MSKPSQTKAAQLDQPFGTASQKLRKMIMFDLVKQLGKDICYRCGKKIESIEEFSIEHKEPWLHSNDPKKLFFSLDNIAFSHCKCNRKAARSNVEAARKARQQMVREGKHKGCKLSEENIKEIKKLGSTMKQSELAHQFGVSKYTIHRILSGKGFVYIE